MKNLFHKLILPTSFVLYILVWKLLGLYLGYMLDSDCVAYLTIANRIAKGEYMLSINGLWSPLNVWCIVPFIKQGIDAFLAAKIVNGIFGGILIIQLYTLLKRFKLESFTQNLIMLAIPLIIGFYSYFQLFGDLLQLIFVMLYVRLIISKAFYSSYGYVILSGVIMGIGFYAKAYSFVFFLLHFNVFLLWSYYSSKLSLKRAALSSLLGIVSCVVVMLPWSFALKQKYGEFSLSGHAGKLNMSWYINSGKSFKPEIKLLIPPTYQDSPSFWEDPYLSQSNLSSPFSSAGHFVRWIARIIHTTFVAIGCFTEISFLALAILFIGIYFYFFRKEKSREESNDFNLQILILTVLVLPIGYLMMHIETRYIWLNTFLILILGAKLLEHFKSRVHHTYLYRIASVLFVVSFVVFPALQIEQLKFKNKSLFEFSDLLKQNNIKGSFTSNVGDAGPMWVVAYLTGNQFYTIERSDYSKAELIAELKRYKVDYYLMEMENNVLGKQVLDSIFKPVLQVQGITVFKIDYN